MSNPTSLTNSQQKIEVQGFPDTLTSITGGLNNQATALMRLPAFRNQFPNIDGRGYSVVVIDTGINTIHPAFAGRIPAQYDFGDNDPDATDVNGHGTNVASIVGSSNSGYLGVAPGVNIIPLKVFTNGGVGTMSMVERALQWVINNASTYNIVSINMSLSDMGNHTNDIQRYGLGDELNRLANEFGIIPVSAAGNFFHPYKSAPGIGYPASDRNSLAIGAVFDRNIGPLSTSSGAVSHTTGTDRITAFSQRHGNITTVMAPGVGILGASRTGTGTSVYTGTSMASPQVAGVVALAQQLAQQTIGRRLTYQEITNLLRDSGTTINDGDDEDDNVTNTGLNFKRVDMMALGQRIQAMGPAIEPSRNLTIIVNGANYNREIQEYGSGQGNANIGPYTANLQNDTLLDITGNTWLQIPLDYNITRNTILEFDFRSTNQGGIHGIGFDTDNIHSWWGPQNSFKLYGPQWGGLTNFSYTNVGNWQNFTIPVGDFFRGNFQHLFFANNHDIANPTANSSYNNIRLYERTFPNLRVTVNGANYTRQIQEYGSDQGNANIGPYTANVQNDTLLNITGNTWLQIPLNYNVTSKTTLKFDFSSTNQGGMHGIGFDADNIYSWGGPHNTFKLYGPQWGGLANFSYTNVGNWQNFTIPVGNFFRGNFQHLFFANNHDIANSTANSQFRDIQIFEQA